MATNALVAYTVRVGLDKSKRHLTLDSFDGAHDIFDFVRLFLEEFKKRGKKDDDLKRTFKVSKLDIDQKNRVIKGLIRSGAYGYEADIEDVDTELVIHKKSAKQAEVLPFYFWFLFPLGKETGLLVLHRFRQFGVRTILEKRISSRFEGLHPGFGIRINPFVHAKAMEALIKRSKCTSVTMTKHGTVNDLTDSDGGPLTSSMDGRLEVRFVPARHSWIPNFWLQRVLGGAKAFELPTELSEFQPESIKAELDIGGRRRTVNISDPGKLRFVYPLDDDEEGHRKPILDYLAVDHEMTALYQDIRDTFEKMA